MTMQPFPVEAKIDPGAEIIDPSEADLAFGEHYEAWLRDHLSGQTEDDIVAEFEMLPVSSKTTGDMRLDDRKLAANRLATGSRRAPKRIGNPQRRAHLAKGRQRRQSQPRRGLIWGISV
ncbi:MAG: hypothetical protein ABSC25_27680 [Roseiarcus sp.]|jgi:hypothetical protein